MMSNQALLNGVVCDSPLKDDRALHFGDGLFETLAIVNGEPCLWDRHFLRLKKGCEQLKITPPEQTLLQAESRQLCQNVERGVLKIIISAGHAERGYARSKSTPVTRLLMTGDWPKAAPYKNSEPVTLGLCEMRLGSQPYLAGIKHLNRIEQVMARKELATDYFEGIMLNQKGLVIEGIMSNLLVQQDGKFVTPSIVDCGVDGVMRSLMLDIAKKNHVHINIEEVSLEQFRDADQIYVMNSLLGVRPVSCFEQREFQSNHITPEWLDAVNTAGFNAETGSL